jgi:hypothetical protein
VPEVGQYDISKMIRLILSALVLSVWFLGCGPNPRQKLVGTWRVEVDASKPQPSKERSEDEAYFSLLRFTFTEDNRVDKSVNGMTESGKYVLTGRTVTMQDLGGQKEEAVIIATMSDDGMSMVRIGMGKPMKFVKER